MLKREKEESRKTANYAKVKREERERERDCETSNIWTKKII